MCCQYPWQQWFLQLTISEDRVGPATKKKFCCITSQWKKGSFLFSSLFSSPSSLLPSLPPHPLLLLLLSLSLSKSNVTITGNRKKNVLVFLNQEPKFQVSGIGQWEAEEGLGFCVPVQKSNIANEFQTQKLESGLRCTLIYTLNKCWVPKWLSVRETQASINHSFCPQGDYREGEKDSSFINQVEIYSWKFGPIIKWQVKSGTQDFVRLSPCGNL